MCQYRLIGDPGHDNVTRASAARKALAEFPYLDPLDKQTSIIDLIADLLHLAREESISEITIPGDEYGMNPYLILDRARTHFEEEVRDEEEWAARPKPPEHLKDAWRRFQEGGNITPYELGRLDEWRADVNEDYGPF